MSTAEDTLPIPPLELRRLVGPTDPQAFDNPTAELVYPYLPERSYRSVLDFGCGCGRIARQLIQQRPRPERYLGIDLHEGMVSWCSKNLAPHAPGFEFRHHDVFNPRFNPHRRRPPSRRKPLTAALPASDGSFTLVNAWSVFTHLTQRQAEHYLAEAARVLEPGGVLHSTWFLFDARQFSVLSLFEDEHALYVHDRDPTQAVLFDREWLPAAATKAGLAIVAVAPPRVRGYQWTLLMAPRREGVIDVDLPPDDAPFGSVSSAEGPHEPGNISYAPGQDL